MNTRQTQNYLDSALFTDLYELTMAQAYCAEGMEEQAVFELYYRELPDNRNYAVAAGIEDVLSYLETLHVRQDEVDYLRGLELFSDRFLDRFKEFRFSGNVHAVPEGTLVFPYEPVVQIEAPIIEAQLVETYILNQIHFQSVAAAKAARVVRAAQGRTVVDFGSRRSHGTDAALKVARVSYLVGAAGTSNVLAGKIYDIPVFGTMAHSYIQAHDDEGAAFDAFSREFPQTTILVDTYDTLDGVRKVIELRDKQGERFSVRAIRLDSGDLAELAKESRRLLDAAGLDQVKIFASSGLDEYKIVDLLQAGAPIDGFGVGTKMAVMKDAPDLDMAYKLVEYAGKPRTKLSSSKLIYPGRKQVFRQSENERFVRDVIARHDEEITGEPLLQPVMKDGKRLTEKDARVKKSSRDYACNQLDRLPDRFHSLTQAANAYPVQISDGLQEELEKLRKQLGS